MSCLSLYAKYIANTTISVAGTSHPWFLVGVLVTWSLVLCVCFVDRCLSFCPFSFGHCVVCSSCPFGIFKHYNYTYNKTYPDIFLIGVIDDRSKVLAILSTSVSTSSEMLKKIIDFNIINEII